MSLGVTEANCQQYFILERISCKRASTENVFLFIEVLVFCDLNTHGGSKYTRKLSRDVSC